MRSRASSRVWRRWPRTRSAVPSRAVRRAASERSRSSRRATARARRARRCATASARACASGTSSSAACEGVAARASATRSVSVTSISWPTALTTGHRRGRDLAHQRLVVEGGEIVGRSAAATEDDDLDLGHAAEERQRARHALGRVRPLHRARAPGGCAPPPRRNATLTMSWMAAPSPLVTTPMTRGSSGSARLRSAANSPSAASFSFSRKSASSSAPRPAGRAMSAMNWSRPRGAYTVARPTSTTRAPSARRRRARAGAVRYMTQSMDASSRSSLREK